MEKMNADMQFMENLFADRLLNEKQSLPTKLNYPLIWIVPVESFSGFINTFQYEFFGYVDLWNYPNSVSFNFEEVQRQLPF
ncbi:hypothetical protein ABEB36_000790 [Hypothenemus hampei]|uniref:Uncharacterized protein n=1 Tax=Hypothenemus hampei TaxID=57062 RepID=A0ABD1FG05_HYPHA